MNIYQSIASVMKEGYAITKSKKNPQQGFMYRGIDDVMNVFQPLMAEAGIFVVPEVLEATREERQTGKGTNLIYSILKIRYTFYASDGTSVSAEGVEGKAVVSGFKGTYKQEGDYVFPAQMSTKAPQFELEYTYATSDKLFKVEEKLVLRQDPELDLRATSW